MQNDALTKNICEFSVENTHTSASVHKALKLFCLQAAMCLETSQVSSKHEAHIVEESFRKKQAQIILKIYQSCIEAGWFFTSKYVQLFIVRTKICQSFSAFYKASQITTMMK